MSSITYLAVLSLLAATASAASAAVAPTPHGAPRGPATATEFLAAINAARADARLLAFVLLGANYVLLRFSFGLGLNGLALLPTDPRGPKVSDLARASHGRWPNPAKSLANGDIPAREGGRQQWTTVVAALQVMVAYMGGSARCREGRRRFLLGSIQWEWAAMARRARAELQCRGRKSRVEEGFRVARTSTTGELQEQEGNGRKKTLTRRTHV
ncbi:hypothetical protein HU200_024937 [Digitaria exilis]|uniref:Uncharacterized protein n=1 Tax=Digitaria exilis TaxID=1010633 RepID=A0A835C0S3_9POAL|nr:hypothetical protein HU200_024937 [Digitaria exilis]